jgi:pimeloyl-ACP methyl ester carboxylesterase
VPPERVEVAPDSGSVQRSGMLPSGPGIQQYVISAGEGQTMTVDVTSDGAPLSLTIESPSGNRWIPEMRPTGTGYTIGHQFAVPEMGDYVVTLGKGDPSPSTNFEATFILQSDALTPTVGQVEANGITIAYESFGPSDRETILLIAGVGMQLTGWPIELIDELVARGYRVVRFDNRDMGLSTKMTEAGLPDGEAISAAVEAGEAPPLPYTLQDMAADAVGLLDALGIAHAHLVGISMGGAIAQFIAIDYPEYALSLTSIAADSGNPNIPVIADPDAFAGVPPQPMTVDKDAFIAWQVKTWQALSGSNYPLDEAILHEQAVRDFERGFDPEAMTRQQTVSLMGHLDTTLYRLNHLAEIAVPTIVLQGGDDPLVPVASAEEIAEHVPGAELRIIPGLGHSIPVELVPEFANAIISVAEQADSVARKP